MLSRFCSSLVVVASIVLLVGCDVDSRNQTKPPLNTSTSVPPTATRLLPTNTATLTPTLEPTATRIPVFTLPPSTRPPTSPPTSPPCNIKGNISFNTGEKIYHVPGGEFYNSTVIDPRYGERWFCTEAEAVANGWRRSSR